jgi:hypothetical protein
MGLFGLFNKPPDFDKMVEEDDIGGIVKLMVRGFNARTQEDADWGNQAKNVFKTRMINERNAKKLTDIILKRFDDDETDAGTYAQALTMMGKDSLLVEPLISRLMEIYYFAGVNAKQFDLSNLIEISGRRHKIINYLENLNDKRIIEPLLLALADPELGLAGNIGFINSLKKFGDDARLKLKEIIASSDPNIYLQLLIEHLFQSYTNSKLRDDPSRVEFVLSILNEDHVLYCDLRAEPNRYMNPQERDRLLERKSAAQRFLASKDRSENKAGTFLSGRAAEVLRYFD